MSRRASIHASAVAIGGQGVLILGPSGCGKSSLVLRLIGQGGVLIADDRVEISCMNNDLSAEIIAAPPPPIAGLIEARGVGILRVAHAPAPICLVVDLGRTETERLPPIRHTDLLDRSLPLVLGPLTDHLSTVVSLLLQGGRIDPDADMRPDWR